MAGEYPRNFRSYTATIPSIMCHGSWRVRSTNEISSHETDHFFLAMPSSCSAVVFDGGSWPTSLSITFCVVRIIGKSWISLESRRGRLQIEFTRTDNVRQFHPVCASRI